MCTLDTDKNSKKAVRTAFIYLVVSILCALFGAVYELFSHGVFSYYMIYAFAYPLVCGVLPFTLLNLISVKRYPSVASSSLYHCGVATLTVGSIIKGVLEIYGTANALTAVYVPIGLILILIGLVSYTVLIIKSWTA